MRTLIKVRLLKRHYSHFNTVSIMHLKDTKSSAADCSLLGQNNLSSGDVSSSSKIWRRSRARRLPILTNGLCHFGIGSVVFLTQCWTSWSIALNSVVLLCNLYVPNFWAANKQKPWNCYRYGLDHTLYRVMFKETLSYQCLLWSLPRC